jgi:hypothetical protein
MGMFQLPAMQFSHKTQTAYQRRPNRSQLSARYVVDTPNDVSAHKLHLKVSSDRMAREDQAPVPQIPFYNTLFRNMRIRHSRPYQLATLK